MMSTTTDTFTGAFNLFQNGQLDEAQAQCQAILQQAPDHSDSLHLLGVILHQRGQHQQGIELIEKAIQINPNEATYYTNLGILLQATQQPAKAINAFSKAIELNPDIAELHNNLGLALATAGHLDKAIPCYQKALELKPAYSEAYNNLGLALKELNRWQDAVNCYQKALELNPNAPEAHYNLGVVALLDGQYDKAITCFERTFKLRSPFAELHYNMGRALQYSGKLKESSEHFRNALEFKPNYADAYNELGMSVHMTGQIEEGREYYLKAIELNPKLEKAYFNLGTAYGDLGDLDEALKCYEKALEMKPDYADPLAGIASILERQGKLEEAYNRLKPVIDAGTLNENISMVFANACRHFDRHDEAAQLLEKLLNTGSFPQFKREALHFTLGKVYDEMGEYDKAFDHYEAGNTLKPAIFDADKHVTVMDELIKIYSPDRYKTYPRSTNTSNRPIFIIGMPRSGTSLVEQILASHPDVFGAGELDDMHDLVKDLPRRLNSPNPAYMTCMNLLTQDVLEEMSLEYLNRLNRMSNDARWVTDKMPQNFMHLAFMTLMFPKAHFIHCIRNPLDTCLSCYFQLFSKGHEYSYDLRTLGIYYREYRRLMRHWCSLLDIEILDVSYEEVVADQEGQSRRILEFCNIPWDEACLEFYKTKRVVKTASYDQVRKPIYKKSKGRARNYINRLGPLVEVLKELEDVNLDEF